MTNNGGGEAKEDTASESVDKLVSGGTVANDSHAMLGLLFGSNEQGEQKSVYDKRGVLHLIGLVKHQVLILLSDIPAILRDGRDAK